MHAKNKQIEQNIFLFFSFYVFLLYIHNLQLSELGRPFTGGSWCGAATGPQLYYSETSTVTASVKVYKLIQLNFILNII